ncbi:hypothetical protein [Pyrinomonas methylaliphatogenes]|uniref:hypothetical protein n=1 Tax=Pyrinomonas methylaliphatogenes TaxID=454194 RepID=UPI00138DE0CE|nr:hypothetical protein [Pyrinomonas methylaliphatogenes]
MPPREKPPRGCIEITDEQLDEYLNKATPEQLRTLLIKGWNAGAFRLYVRSAEGTEGAELEIDDVLPWPPGGGVSSTTRALKKKAAKKSTKRMTGKKASKAKKASRKR